MYAVGAVLFRFLSLMFGLSMGGCALALLMAMVEETKATLAEYLNRQRHHGVHQYRCFLLAAVTVQRWRAMPGGHA